MMKKSLLITIGLITFLIRQHCSAQIKTTNSSTIKFADIRTVILKNFKVEQGFLDTACINTVVLVKFKILHSKIDSIEFTRSVPTPIRQALKKALRVDKGGFTLKDGKSYEKKTIILPIHFAYLSSCKQAAPIEVDSNGVIIASKKSQQTSMTLALKEMLNFDSGNKASIECIWLSSMYFTSMF
jgi:hypothetical protein